MTAVPADTPVTTPAELTLATLALELRHVTAAVEGVTVAMSSSVSPTATLAVAGATARAVTVLFAICPIVSGV